MVAVTCNFFELFFKTSVTEQETAWQGLVGDVLPVERLGRAGGVAQTGTWARSAA